MKTLSLLLLMAISTVAFSQSETVKLYIHLKYEDGSPYSNSRVYLKSLEDQNVAELRSDSQGKLKYRVLKNSTYELQLKKDKTFATIKISKKNRSFITKTFTINPKEYPTYPSDTIYQNINPRTDLPSQAYGIAEIFLGDKNQKPIKKIEVRLFNKKTGKTYITTTTNTGRAFFRLPNNATYDLGLETLNRYKVIKIPNKPDVYYKTGFLFEPTNISETLVNDTIRQDLPTQASATSTRALVHILVKNYEDEPLANEQVALNPRGDSLTYLGYTNEQGIVEFLLPAGKQYVLHFYYERNIDLLDYRNKSGLHKTNIKYTYIGTQAIQDFYRQANRDNSGFITDFMEIPIEPLNFDEKNHIEITKHGFNINFKQDKGQINTPTIANGKIYTNEGYYSRNLHVFDEKTGDLVWSISLKEGGPSSLVYENGVLLVITQSCTLYAIDANTGKLIWSKYLAPDMYSTPSVSNGKVIATYPKGLNAEERFVLGCFDLKTGRIEWQKMIDAEAISVPVVENGKIYTATRTGRLFQHDLNTGKKLQVANLKAVTSPTIVDNEIFISVLKTKKIQHLIKVKTDDFKQQTPLNNLFTSFKSQPVGGFLRMNFDGIRPLHKAGKNYLVVNQQLICADNNGEILWQTPLKMRSGSSNKYNIMPILAGNTIVATKGNYIQLFDATTGKPIKDYKIQGETFIQPSIHNGVIYAGCGKRLITIDTKDETLTGWSMWGGNASHNTVIKGINE